MSVLESIRLANTLSTKAAKYFNHRNNFNRFISFLTNHLPLHEVINKALSASLPELTAIIIHFAISHQNLELPSYYCCKCKTKPS